MTVRSDGAGSEEGGDPACWAHLFDDAPFELDDRVIATFVRDASDAIIICDRASVEAIAAIVRDDPERRTELQRLRRVSDDS